MLTEFAHQNKVLIEKGKYLYDKKAKLTRVQDGQKDSLSREAMMDKMGNVVKQQI